MTGVFFRVEREGKFKNIEIEHMTDDEREQIFKDDSSLMQAFNLVCQKLAETEKLFDELEQEGILQRA